MGQTPPKQDKTDLFKYPQVVGVVVVSKVDDAGVVSGLFHLLQDPVEGSVPVFNSRWNMLCLVAIFIRHRCC